ncbi:MAG: hypothetical protein ACK4OF_03815 [Aquificaceae bacterium]
MVYVYTKPHHRVYIITMLELKERDPLSNLILEVLEDPSKKEMVYYLMCYSQLVRREESTAVELSRFLSCAYRNFQKARSYWKDLLVSMNLFVISDLYGNTFTGKDIYKVEEEGIYFISLRREYLNQVDSINYKALRLWNILSKIGVYRRYFTAQDAVIVSAIMFNEGLYQEAEAYCEVCIERFPLESSYFRALCKLSRLYWVDGVETQNELKQVIKDLGGLGHVYYSINLLKLKRDIEHMLKGNYISPIRIEFVGQKGQGNFIDRIVEKIKQFLKDLFIKRRAYSFEGGTCSKSFQTLSTSS